MYLIYTSKLRGLYCIGKKDQLVVIEMAFPPFHYIMRYIIHLRITEDHSTQQVRTETDRNDFLARKMGQLQLIVLQNEGENK